MNDHGHQDRKWFAGLDLGQSQDHTALALVERMTMWQQERDAQTLDRVTDTTYNVRHLERTKLGTPYQAIVERVRNIVETSQLEGKITLVVDATGVGGPVVDLLRSVVTKAPIVPVVITGGDRPAYQDGRYRIPKRDLIAGLTVLLETGKLKVSQKLPEAKTLTKELGNMRVKISSSGHDAYEAWRSGDHDDMVLALALALWRAKMAARRQMAIAKPLFR
jgi:hypothetical protein